MKTIIHAVDIEVPQEKVYKALTTRDGNASWLSTSVEAPETTDVGDVIDFTFQKKFNPNMEVTELKENEYVAWKCIGDAEGWQDNTFTFMLSDNGSGGTTLLFTQNYATELDDTIYGVFNFNWGYYLRSLKEYLEAGKGFPFEVS